MTWHPELNLMTIAGLCGGCIGFAALGYLIYHSRPSFDLYVGLFFCFLIFLHEVRLITSDNNWGTGSANIMSHVEPHYNPASKGLILYRFARLGIMGLPFFSLLTISLLRKMKNN